MRARLPEAVTTACGTRFAVAAGHPAAAAMACEIFERGGSVADAALAASALLCAALPQATGIGGDMMALYRDAASGSLVGLDAAGVAPAAALPARFPDGVPLKGVRAAVVPGIVAGWDCLHRRFGRLAWRELIRPAAQLAASGVARSAGIEEFLAECASDLQADAGCRQLFMTPQEDPARLRQQALSDTLERIARGGADEFYRGPTGERLAGFLQRNEGLIGMDDLRAYRPRWVEPLRGHYRGHEVHVLPPSSFGLLLLLQLAGLQGVDAYPASQPALRFSAQLNAMRAAFELGEPFLHDDGPALDDAAVERLAEQMARRMARPRETPAELHGGTACVVAGDSRGNAIVLVQSIYQPFGAACADPGTGILLNNRLSAFGTDPDAPNCVAPGKRPRHTLCPTLVLRDGRPCIAVASPGGLSQTVTLTQVISNLIDLELPASQAIEAPRWCLGRKREIFAEPALADALPKADAAAGSNGQPNGQPVVRYDPYSFGSAKAIVWQPDGEIVAAADSRRDASAAAS
ncbi:MAG: gamma-glutamyltransferase family protein [Burkholderiaceae bacterium]